MCLKDSRKRRVAIVGGGATGLAAAWHLHVNSPDIDVHLFEADSRLGGHAHTISIHNGNEIDKEDNLDVDVGFMVFNQEN